MSKPSRTSDVRWFRSLGGKLFLLVAVCLLAAVTTVSLRNVSAFSIYLEARLQGSAQQGARDAAANVASAFDNWSAQTAAVMHQAFSSKAGSLNGLLRGLVVSNSDLVAAEVYEGGKLIARATTDEKRDIRFEDKDVKVALGALSLANAKWAKDFGSTMKQSVAVFVPPPKVGLPLVNLSRRFSTLKGKDVWVILSLWQTRLLASLPQSTTVYSMLMDARGRLVLLNAGGEQVSELQSAADHFASFVKQLDLPYGSSNYTDSSAVPRIGAYAQIPRYGLSAVVSSDARPGQSAIRGMIFDTAKWSWVVILGAMMLSYVSVSTVTRKLKAATEATKKIAGGDFAAEIDGRGGDEVAVLSRSVNHMAFQIQELLKSKVEAARQEKELETARIVQETLFPKGDIQATGVSIVGRNRVASECGGDWWGHFETDDGLHCIMIADVTGHGAAAALVTALAYASLKTIAETYKDPAVHKRSVVQILQSMNRLLWSTGSGNTTMTALVMLLDPHSGEVIAASAGHCMPYLIPAGAAVGAVVPPTPVASVEAVGDTEGAAEVTPEVTKRFKVLKLRGAILGMDASPEFKETRFQMQSGDKVLMYTDGLIECVDTKGTRWGKRSMERIVSGHCDESATVLCDAVIGDAYTHFGTQPVDDDVTVLVVERVALAAQQTPKPLDLPAAS